MAIGSSGGDNKKMWQKIREKEKTLQTNIFIPYEKQKEKEVGDIIRQAEVHIDKSDLPFIHYRVEFNLIPKALFLNGHNKILHADQISIVDLKDKKIIAFSKRYMAYSWTRYFGAPPAFGFYKIGDARVYEFDDQVLFEFAKENRKGSECHSSLFHRNINFNR